MIVAARRWYFSRSQREQWLVGLAFVLTALVLAWAVIIRPLGDALDAARTRHADAVERMGEMRAMVDALSALKQHRVDPIGVPLEDFIRSAAGEDGFALDNVAAQPSGTVQITLPSARPAALFSWLATLEQRGVLVVSLAMRDNGDATVACDVGLKARGA
ncbi:MAG: type II secretion system protein GspM [Sphingomonas sp.]